MNRSNAFWPTGTVYGCLLNFRAELVQLGEQVTQPPYKAAPRAPVLYIKTANTWSANGDEIPVDTQYQDIEVGASIAMVMGPAPAPGHAVRGLARVAAYVLVNDLSLPHASFFRPPVKFKCQDGFLGVGDQRLDARAAGDPADFVLEVHINGDLRHQLVFSDLVRDAACLIDDVGDFMGLREGDLLMLGCAPGRPLARVGDLIEIHAPAVPALGLLRNRLCRASEAA